MPDSFLPKQRAERCHLLPGWRQIYLNVPQAWWTAVNGHKCVSKSASREKDKPCRPLLTSSTRQSQHMRFTFVSLTDCGGFERSPHNKQKRAQRKRVRQRGCETGRGAHLPVNFLWLYVVFRLIDWFFFLLMAQNQRSLFLQLKFLKR